MPEVRLASISKAFGKVVAVQNFNLTVKDKEYVTILGPSGCGKTTVIKMIAGIFEPNEGDVFIGGKRVNDVPVDERDLGYVFQNIALFPHMDVRDNVGYGPRVKSWNAAKMNKTIDEILKLIKMKIHEQKIPSELSGGTQQKTSLGRALASGAKLLLLDEPLSALDARVRIELRRELRKLVKSLGLTAIHVTHDLEEAMSISDRIVLMRNGEIVEINTPENLYHRPKTLFAANFIGEMNFIEVVVESMKGDFVNVVTRIDERLKVKNKDCEIGDSLILAIRPENTYLNTGIKENAILGVVKNVIFMGSYLRYQIRLWTGDTLISDVSPTYDKRFNIGSIINVNFKSDRILAYTKPKEGLREAIKLE